MESARRIDLIKDLATPATYGIIREVYGVQAPEWLTEISAAMRFARQHVGDLPSDWLAKLAGREPDRPRRGHTPDLVRDHPC